MRRKTVPANFKIILVILALGLVMGVLFYTQTIVQKLQAREAKSAKMYVHALEYLGSDQSSTGDITFVTDYISSIDFPILYTDADQVPMASLNIKIDSSLSHAQQTEFLKHERDRMKNFHAPLIMKYQDSVIMHYFYYDESRLVKELRILPYIEILLAGLFILVGYIGFSYIKRSEQANIWVGLSKETAHQLGTPLSSMLGWLELLRSQNIESPVANEAINEMENDVHRLNRIAMRFSKIGSRPELTEQSLSDTVQKSVEYFRKRTPQQGMKVDILVHAHSPVRYTYNAELFEWVLENLMKNALDAMDGKTGKIEFIVSKSMKYVTIDVKDSGRGLDMRMRKDIFRPGFSTKKRGWGLGLSLSKRIIENYHGGRLYVLDSAAGKGTTIRIKLPIQA
jgi:signal transduction histidine kinase